MFTTSDYRGLIEYYNSMVLCTLGINVVHLFYIVQSFTPYIVTMRRQRNQPGILPCPAFIGTPTRPFRAMLPLAKTWDTQMHTYSEAHVT